MPLALGKYERYVRAATFALDWLLRAHEHSRPSLDILQLKALSSVVQQTAKDPSTLTPELLQQLPTVLKAFHCASQLRDFVTPLLANSKSQFATLLKIWGGLLQRVPLESDHDSFESSEWEEDEDFYCPGEESFTLGMNPSKRLKSVCEEAFRDDLALDVVFFVTDLEQLVRGVHECYRFVKLQTSTLMEATVSVKLAMDTAKDLTTKLQSRHPEIRSTPELFDVVYEQAPGLIALSRKVSKDLRDKFERGEPYRPYPFELLGGFQMILSSLNTFASALPAQCKTEAIFLTNVVERFGEERTPEYLYSDPFNVSAFLMQQLPLVYNDMREKEKNGGAGFDPSKLEGAFLGLLDEFFTSRQVTIPLVFAITCWMKSIVALQGNGGLGRNVSVMFKHARSLNERMDEIMARPSVLPVMQEPLSTELQQDRAHIVERFNPVLAGLKVMDHHLDYLRKGSEILPSGSLFRAFGHLYNALVAEGFLERIPFFDDVLEIYERTVFTPSRSAATHGAYDRTYLLPAQTEEPKGLYLRDVSQVWRFLAEGDASGLERTSLVKSLYSAGSDCVAELLETRVLSRDMLALTYDIVDVLSKLCEELDQQQYYDDYINKQLQLPGKSREDCLPDALENAVMRPLLPLLDALQSNGSLKLDALPDGLSTRWEGKMNGERVREMGKKAGAVLSAKFASHYTASYEQKYFTFPSKPDLANQEYGDVSFRAKRTGTGRERVFSELMQLLEQSTGRLYEDDLERLKTEIKNDPLLLAMITPRTKDNQDDLCTLLHQAAAGPAHDPDLVEWMIHLGALYLQPTVHCRSEPKKKDLPCPRECFPNAMAVHSAAAKGHTDTVLIILAADNLLDLNTPTFHAKETIAHLAVKNGHSDLFKALCAFGPDLTIQDKAGNPVLAVTTNRVWARKIEAEAGSTETFKAADQSSAAYRQLQRPARQAGSAQRSTFARRGEENISALESDDTNVASSTNKKTAKKKMKKGKSKQ